VCVNTIHLKSSRDGLPLQFVIRGINSRRTLEEAIDFVRAIKVGAAQNLMIGNAERVVDLECSANKVVEYRPFEDARRVYHTNHHLVNDDVITGYPTITGSSLDRLKYLMYRLGDSAKPITVDNVKGILSSHLSSICYHGEYSATAVNTWVSVVYSLSTPPELHLAIGNPCANDYERFTFA
jgi:isopenicillin-N N-acyltransferase-like protein